MKIASAGGSENVDEKFCSVNILTLAVDKGGG